MKISAKPILAIVKFSTFLIILGTMLDLILASYNIPPYISPIFGSGLVSILANLGVTYTKLGKKYFTNIFRISLGFLLALITLEQIDIIFVCCDTVQYYNISFAFIGIAFFSSVISLMVSKDE